MELGEGGTARPDWRIHLRETLRLLAAEPVAARPIEGLGADLQTIRGAVDQLEVQSARRVERFDRERGYDPEGDLSTTGWLRRRCRLSGAAASQQVELARRLPELEPTVQALESGQIGFEHALEISRAVADLGQGAQKPLLEAAHRQDPHQLRDAARDLRHQVDPQGSAREAARQQEERRLRLYDLPDGMLGLDGALSPEGGALLRLSLDKMLGPRAAGDRRTAEQRNADALLGLCRQPGRGNAQLTVIVREQTLRGEPGAPAARLKDGTPLSGATARRLACDGSVRLLRLDPNGNPLEMGRARRLATERQKKALAVRDGGCGFPACDRPADWCESHHLDDWVLGGRTNVDRMVLLCQRHHTLVHEGGWRLVEQEGQVLALPPAGRGP